MERVYQIVESSVLWSQQTNSKVNIITYIYDAENEADLKPNQILSIWEYFAPVSMYLTVCKTNYNPLLESEMIRILSLTALDREGFYIKDFEIPKNEIWTCSMELARRNNWI